jgi:hypothetical protein
MKRILLAAVFLISAGLLGNYSVGDGWRGWISDGNGSRVEFDEQVTAPTINSSKIGLYFRNLASDLYPILAWNDNEATALGEQLVTNVMYLTVNDDTFVAPLSDSNLSIHCVGVAGNAFDMTADEECSAVYNKGIGYVRAGSTFVLHDIVATASQACGGTAENCQLYFKTHDALGDDPLCDAGGAGPHLCDDTDVVLTPLLRTGDYTCGGNCSSWGTLNSQQIVTVNKVSTGKWSIGVGPKKYCSFGSSETDGGDICLTDADCEGTCVTLAAGTGTCSGLSALQLELRYSIYD